MESRKILGAFMTTAETYFAIEDSCGIFQQWLQLMEHLKFMLLHPPWRRSHYSAPRNWSNGTFFPHSGVTLSELWTLVLPIHILAHLGLCYKKKSLAVTSSQWEKVRASRPQQPFPWTLMILAAEDPKVFIDASWSPCHCAPGHRATAVFLLKLQLLYPI